MRSLSAPTPRDWDLLDLRWIASSELDRTGEAMREAGFQAQQQPWIRTSLVDMGRTDWHTYWAGRTSRWRNNVRRSERKLAEAGEVTHLRYRAEPGRVGPMDPRWDLYDACLELAGRSWQATASDGTTLSHESVRGFLRDTHAAAAERGAIDINLLYRQRPARGVCLQLCLARLGLRLADGLRRRLEPATAPAAC